MSLLDQKTYDIVLEVGADFGLRLRLKEVEETCTNHPVTGEPENCVEEETGINLTDYTFSGVIADGLGSSANDLANFSFQITDYVEGIVEMTLSKEVIGTLVGSATGDRDKYNPRLRFLGYYDVVSRDTVAALSTRIMQGKVYISDGVA